MTRKFPISSSGNSSSSSSPGFPVEFEVELVSSKVELLNGGDLFFSFSSALQVKLLIFVVVIVVVITSVFEFCFGLKFLNA